MNLLFLLLLLAVMNLSFVEEMILQLLVALMNQLM
jgi:hypothetical protein